ncbi:hypothetical protein [Allokutzneria sp. NRRL B-24872]|uniref:hypothetical protein n=1 Tax=Allokutzneria sp. NRRL B-24872 TaxID=1137961 RepID=UPI001177989F|nr:hypothetical protein [Allokutzneria sp. NRRL B-24872]
MSSCSVEYLPAARKVLSSVSSAVRAEIQETLRRRAAFASNISCGSHRRFEAAGSGVVATYVIRHEGNRLVVLEIQVRVL